MSLPTVIRGVGGAPGVIGYDSGLTTGIFNELNYVIPEYKDKLFSKYGNDSYMLVAEVLGRSTIEEVSTTTNTISHFEKGRIFGVGFVNADVSSSSGADITITLKSPESYNDGDAGTQSPFVTGQTVKVRSTGRKAKVGTVTRTTDAFTVVLTPLGSYSLVSSTSTTNIKAGEAIEAFGGTQLAGESSSAQKTTSPKIYRYDNTCTVLRTGVKASDLVAMNKTQIDFGGSNYHPTLAVTTMNQQFMYSIEDAVMEGVPDDNIAGTTGTIGVMPEVESRGIETKYIKRDVKKDDFNTLTRLLEWNGGASEYHLLQDTYSRQDVNSALFGLFPNGMISYGSVGFGSEAAVGMGFRSLSTDTFSFHFHRYKGYSPEAMYGYTPTVGNYRGDFSLAVPQGMVQDAKLNVARPQLQWVYQKSPDFAGKIYSWSLGYTQGTKTEEASNSYHQICYVGSRVICAEQFGIWRGSSLS
jgi:hypothetical protein